MWPVRQLPVQNTACCPRRIIAHCRVWLVDGLVNQGIVAVQTWELNDAGRGGLSSHALSILVMVLLGRKGHSLDPAGGQAGPAGNDDGPDPAQPQHQPCHNLAEVLHAFCEFFGKEVDYDTSHSLGGELSSCYRRRMLTHKELLKHLCCFCR